MTDDGVDIATQTAEERTAEERTAEERTAEERTAEEPADKTSEQVGADASVELSGLDDPIRLKSAVEAVLFVVESPASAEQLASALGRPAEEIGDALASLTAEYDRDSRGFELRPAGGGFRIYTRPEHAAAVEAFLLDGQRSRLSQAALETLAVIAYRQPVTRARISAIRGVNVDGVVRTLLSRGLIVEVGSDPETGGGLYRTSEVFLERLGLTSLEELPSLAPLLPDLDTLEGIEGMDGHGF